MGGALGHFEYSLLFVVVALGDGVGGRGIRAELKRRTGRDVSSGAVYSVLRRLEAKGFIDGWLGEETPQRGGRRSRHYRILPAGARALLDAHEQLERLSSGLLDDVKRLAQTGSGGS